MDAHKRLKLLEIDYEVQACQLCHYFVGESDPMFGSCSRYTYRHIKGPGYRGRSQAAPGYNREHQRH